MKYLSMLMASFLLLSPTSVCASQIARISLSELQAKADLVVLAKVLEVVQEAHQDLITIRADSCLKGTNPQGFYTFTLISRGGVEKAYWGSVALFQKNHFTLTPAKAQAGRSARIDLPTSLGIWRSFRIQRGQVRDGGEYERGFRKGYAGPPGLVDGSADFNLGHSDGMLAKMKISPPPQEGDDSK